MEGQSFRSSQPHQPLACRIHERHAQRTLAVFAPYHSTAEYSRLLQISRLEGTVFKVFKGTKSTGAVVPRVALVKCCCKDQVRSFHLIFFVAALECLVCKTLFGVVAGLLLLATWRCAAQCCVKLHVAGLCFTQFCAVLLPEHCVTIVLGQAGHAGQAQKQLVESSTASCIKQLLLHGSCRMCMLGTLHIM